MEIQNFIEKFIEAVEIESVSNLSADTEFRKLEEWSSLAGLSLIAMFDEEFSISITGKQLRECVTIEDLYKLV